MTNELLERNLGRLVKRWADPLTPARIENACGDFVRRVAASPDAESRRSPASALVAFAAILLLCVAALWIGFSRDAARNAPAPVVRPAGQDAPDPLRRRLEARQAEKQPLPPVQAALCWLARHQNEDGSWSSASFADRCTGTRCSGGGEREYDAGVTSLALLAFLGAGYSQLSKDELADPTRPGTTMACGEVVKKGLRWILAQQAPDGAIGPRDMKFLYNHAIATFCLAEAYGGTAAPPLKEPAQKALDFLAAAQNPGKAWRYSAKSGDNDTSVMSWAVMALHAAEEAGLHAPRPALEGALRWLDEATDPEPPYRTGYNARGTGKVYIPGKNESFVHHETMTAIAILSRTFLLKKKTEQMTASLRLIARDLPDSKPDRIDFYYWHYGALAVYQMDGPDGPQWKQWNEALKGALLPQQKKDVDGCAAGSWASESDRWGAEGGRIYVTAMGALILETYYRYPNVFGGK